jgi:hypothetical protein
MEKEKKYISPLGITLVKCHRCKRLVSTDPVSLYNHERYCKKKNIKKGK